jgi:integrase/recombinase XerD
MSALRQRAEEYLKMRRSLGYKLQRQGPMLLDFISYLEHAGASTVTTEAAVAWATQPAGAALIWWKRRLTVVRGFARHLNTLDPGCQVPPAALLPSPSDRVTPYLFSQEEIAALIHAAGTLRRPLLAATYQALISLLAVTGLRIGEAVALSGDHVDFEAALITVINSKFGKSRLVPLHGDTVDMLRRYAARRDELCPALATGSFFISTTGRPLLHSSVDGIFAQLLGLAGIGTPPGRARPRVHDLRH